MTKDSGPRSPLPWRQRKTPKRGTRKATRWRRIHVGYVFPGTVWTVTQGPYRLLKRNKSKSWVSVVCGDCGREYERRLDHLVGGKSHRCLHCSPMHTKAWTHWADKREAREKEKKESTVGVVPLTESESESGTEEDKDSDPVGEEVTVG